MREKLDFNQEGHWKSIFRCHYIHHESVGNIPRSDAIPTHVASYKSIQICLSHCRLNSDMGSKPSRRHLLNAPPKVMLPPLPLVPHCLQNKEKSFNNFNWLIQVQPLQFPTVTLWEFCACDMSPISMQLPHISPTCIQLFWTQSIPPFTLDPRQLRRICLLNVHSWLVLLVIKFRSSATRILEDSSGRGRMG
jgi:hypothetical protein